MPVDRGMDRDVARHVGEYHSAVKRNEAAPLADTWVDLETVVHNEGN